MSVLCATDFTPAAVHVVEGNDVAATITATAERLGLGVIVVGTEGRGGVARPVFGSVVQSVMLRSRRPVLVVPPARVLTTHTLSHAHGGEVVNFRSGWPQRG